ncbi:GNAT family N-acetyltransferase [Marinomonas balearica]|uniref:Ribosomal-protein-alanine N-acetyltransferase n=1 Tax=Marinomonas balearica TaxID=491947 RepID=A0A4R6MDA8_9GAMM|nr:GNAT family N-acetyltransferase [Marinomonas balearica]TDO99677.1 ribosomal-protein-alanine N-acetyltransferase [Marinomonas balearica]
MSNFALPTPPYFMVILSTSELYDDLMFKVMSEKVLELAEKMDGFLGHQWTCQEESVSITYWDSVLAARDWMQHPMHTKTINIGNQFWFSSYSLKLAEVKEESRVVGNSIEGNSSRFPHIETSRGILKVLSLENVHLLYDFVNREREHLARWEPTRNEEYYTLKTCELRIKEMRRDFLEDKGVVLCLLDKTESEMIAYTNFSAISRGVFQSCCLGYSLSKSYEGQGYMTEALRAGIEFMKSISIDRIQASHMPVNKRSAAVLNRLGFEKEGVAKNYLKINGEWEDHIVTALLMRD